MLITKKTHRLYRLQQAIFYLLLFVIIFLLAKASLSTNKHFDLTANGRHTLSPATKQFLHQLKSPIDIEIFISPDSKYRDTVESLMARYQTQTHELKISYINPDLSPEKVRKLNIQQQGEMVVSKGNRQQHVKDLSEQSLTNAMVAVSRKKEPWLVFIEGHGERSPFSKANFGLSTWAAQLKSKGFQLKGLNLAKNPQIPRNAAAVVIASPQTAWLPGEVKIIKDYVAHGGNLLWLTEPENNQFLAPLAEALNIEFVKGMVVDPNTSVLGIKDPRFVLITDYANNAIGKAVKTVTLLPKAVAMEPRDEDNQDWNQTDLLTSQANTWSETSDIDDPKQNTKVVYDKGTDIPGPLTLGYVMTRKQDDDKADQQRVAVIGDGDFISNTYIGNGANLNLGMAVINWLTNDDQLISIPVKTTIDSQLNLSRPQSLMIGIGFLLVIPVILLGVGFGVWWLRRRR